MLSLIRAAGYSSALRFGVWVLPKIKLISICTACNFNCNFAPGIYPRPACGVLARRCRAAHARARNGLKKRYAAARLFLPCRVRFPLCVSAVVARVRGCLVFGLSRMIRSNSGCARKEIAPCFAGLSLYLKNRQARPPPSSKAAVPL